MKILLAFLLSLMLVFSSVPALAADTFLGTWHMEYSADEAGVVTYAYKAENHMTITFNEDGTYFCIVKRPDGHIPLAGYWEQSPDGIEFSLNGNDMLALLLEPDTLTLFDQTVGGLFSCKRDIPVKGMWYLDFLVSGAAMLPPSSFEATINLQSKSAYEFTVRDSNGSSLDAGNWVMLDNGHITLNPESDATDIFFDMDRLWMTVSEDSYFVFARNPMDYISTMVNFYCHGIWECQQVINGDTTYPADELGIAFTLMLDERTAHLSSFGSAGDASIPLFVKYLGNEAQLYTVDNNLFSTLIFHLENNTATMDINGLTLVFKQ